jgi:Family of unknown function (DUF6062)
MMGGWSTERLRRLGLCRTLRTPNPSIPRITVAPAIPHLAQQLDNCLVALLAADAVVATDVDPKELALGPLTHRGILEGPESDEARSNRGLAADGLYRCERTRMEVMTPPNSALTRFIKQGLRKGVCPLCRVAYKVDGEYMWAFFDEYSSDAKTLDRLREARGFCTEHAERLRRLEVEGLRSNLGISNVYLDTLQGLAEMLRSLDAAEDMGERDPCPACAYRDEEVEKNARCLLEEVDANESSRQLLVESNGLCFPHLGTVWDRANQRQRELLRDVQLRVVTETAGRLSENIRKQGHEYDGEPEEREADSWRQAIYLTAGWEKEALRDEPPERPYEVPHYASVATSNKGKRRAKSAERRR